LKISFLHKIFLTSLNTTIIPSSVSEALKKNNTWKLVTLPPSKNLLEYTLKFYADGTIERYKTKVVAKRFNETYGVD